MSRRDSSLPDPSEHCSYRGRALNSREAGPLRKPPPRAHPHGEAHPDGWRGPRSYRYGALALALVGLFALWIAARSSSVQTIEVRDITSTMNWAYVKVAGVVVDHPAQDPQSGRLTFRVDDGTGEITIVAYRDEGQTLVETGNVPSIGDRISVEGELWASQDFQSLTVRVPERVVLDRAVPLEHKIGSISEKQVHRKVLLRGQVRAVRSPYEGLVLFTLCDETGKIEVAWDLQAWLFDEPVDVVPGDSVIVCGAVTLYGGKPQISPDSPNSVQLLQEIVEIAAPKEVGHVDRSDLGRMVRVKGTISTAQSMSSGRKLVLEDPTGSIPVVLWQSVLELLPDGHDLEVGMHLDVQGRIAEYGGELEVIPELVTDIRAIGMPEVSTLEVSLADLGAAHLGRTVITTGQIVRLQPFSAGTRFVLRDGGATLVFVFWQNLYYAYPNKQHLVPGARISVRGVVESYGGSLEIVPGHSDDVVFLSMDALPSDGRRRIGSLCSEDAGRRWEIEGQIAAVQYLAAGERWLVDDGSGSIAVHVWTIVSDPLTMTFEVGTLVGVTGELSVSQGALELIPVGPTDLKWLGRVTPATSTATATTQAHSTPSATATPISAPTATSTPLPTPTLGIALARTGDASRTSPGSEVTSQGIVVDARAFATGVKFQLDDGSGPVAVWVPGQTFRQFADVECWVVGGTVRVTGVAQLYDDEIEIEPRSAAGATCVARAQPVEAISIGSLHSADWGQRTTVEGRIVETIPFSKGMKYVLEDSSGRVILLLWQEVLDLVRNGDQLVAGAMLQVSGTVDEYQGELQIVPSVGADITLR